MLICTYDDKEFFRVGYYVNNYYEDQKLAENPPTKPQVKKIKRSLLADKPRLVKFDIDWTAGKNQKTTNFNSYLNVDDEKESSSTIG